MKFPKSNLRHGETWENRSPKSQSRSPLRGDMGLGKPVPMSAPPTWDDRRRPPRDNATAAIEITFSVGRYVCHMAYPLPAGSGQLEANWSPEMPAKLSAAEMSQYRAGRDALIAQVAEQTGLNVAVVEP